MKTITLNIYDIVELKEQYPNSFKIAYTDYQNKVYEIAIDDNYIYEQSEEYFIGYCQCNDIYFLPSGKIFS